MSGRKIHYRDRFDLVRASGATQSRDEALRRARDLFRNQRAEIYRLEGPGGEIVQKDDVMTWVYANRW